MLYTKKFAGMFLLWTFVSPPVAMAGKNVLTFWPAILAAAISDPLPGPDSGPTGLVFSMGSYSDVILTAGTPSPAPAPIEGVQVLLNHSSYSDSLNNLHVVGEVLNNSSSTISSVGISVNFLDSSGTLVGYSFTSVKMDQKLPPGEQTCFKTTVRNPGNVDSYIFEPVTALSEGDIPAIPLLTVTEDSGSYDNMSGSYSISGTIRNDSGRPVEYVYPIATLYTEEGLVAGCNDTSEYATPLDDGQSSSFAMTLSERDFVDVTSYRLQVVMNSMKY